MNLPKATTRAFAQQLQKDFVGATRPARHPEWVDQIEAIQTDQVFDALKIFALLRQLDLAVELPPLVDCEPM